MPGCLEADTISKVAHHFRPVLVDAHIEDASEKMAKNKPVPVQLEFVSGKADQATTKQEN